MDAPQPFESTLAAQHSIVQMTLSALAIVNPESGLHLPARPTELTERPFLWSLAHPGAHCQPDAHTRRPERKDNQRKPHITSFHPSVHRMHGSACAALYLCALSACPALVGSAVLGRAGKCSLLLLALSARWIGDVASGRPSVRGWSVGLYQPGGGGGWQCPGWR